VPTLFPARVHVRHKALVLLLSCVYTNRHTWRRRRTDTERACFRCIISLITPLRHVGTNLQGAEGNAQSAREREREQEAETFRQPASAFTSPCTSPTAIMRSAAGKNVGISTLTSCIFAATVCHTAAAAVVATHAGMHAHARIRTQRQETHARRQACIHTHARHACTHEHTLTHARTHARMHTCTYTRRQTDRQTDTGARHAACRPQ
jgi:hypothetical protein